MTPSIVAFTKYSERSIALHAQRHAVINPSNTVSASKFKDSDI